MRPCVAATRADHRFVRVERHRRERRVHERAEPRAERPADDAAETSRLRSGMPRVDRSAAARDRRRSASPVRDIERRLPCAPAMAAARADSHCGRRPAAAPIRRRRRPSRSGRRAAGRTRSPRRARGRADPTTPLDTSARVRGPRCSGFDESANRRQRCRERVTRPARRWSCAPDRRRAATARCPSTEMPDSPPPARACAGRPSTDRSPASADRASRPRRPRRRSPGRSARRGRGWRRRRRAARLRRDRAPLPRRRAAADRSAPSRPA